MKHMFRAGIALCAAVLLSSHAHAEAKVRKLILKTGENEVISGINGFFSPKCDYVLSRTTQGYSERLSGGDFDVVSSNAGGATTRQVRMRFPYGGVVTGNLAPMIEVGEHTKTLYHLAFNQTGQTKLFFVSTKDGVRSESLSGNQWVLERHCAG